MGAPGGGVAIFYRIDHTGDGGIAGGIGKVGGRGLGVRAVLTGAALGGSERAVAVVGGEEGGFADPVVRGVGELRDTFANLRVSVQEVEEVRVLAAVGGECRMICDVVSAQED